MINVWFEGDNENDDYSIGIKTAKVFEKNAVCNCYYKMSELSLVLQSGYCESPLGYNKVDWIADEVKIIEKK